MLSYNRPTYIWAMGPILLNFFNHNSNSKDILVYYHSNSNELLPQSFAYDTMALATLYTLVQK